jgi:HTH-type transcriptional regulator/antitoxin HigA
MATRPNGGNEYAPDSVSPPGATLQDVLDERGMTQADLATRTGRTPKLVNEVIKGKAPITPATALQLERALGIPAGFWSNRERQYREALARQEEGERLEEGLGWLDRFPVSAMARRGWIRKCRDGVDQLREVLSFFGVASPEAWDKHWGQAEVSYRKSRAFEADRYALAAWLRRGEIEGQALECAPYDAGRFRSVLSEVRALTVEPPEVFRPRLVEKCASCGVAVVFVPSPPKTRASGATRWLGPAKALIQLSLRYKKDDRFWFTVFHESGHVLHDSKKGVFIEADEPRDGQEEWADGFASEFLVPERDLDAFVASCRERGRFPGKAAIRAFAVAQGVAPGVVVGRLQHRGDLPWDHCNDLKRTFEWAGVL